MFGPKILAAGTLLMGVVGLSLYISRDADIWKSDAEIRDRDLCVALTSKLAEGEVTKVRSWANGIGGHYVVVNVDEGPDIKHGWDKKPNIKWGAECGFGPRGKILLVGIYHIEKDVYFGWSEMTGWLNLKKLWNNEPVEVPALPDVPFEMPTQQRKTDQMV